MWVFGVSRCRLVWGSDATINVGPITQRTVRKPGPGSLVIVNARPEIYVTSLLSAFLLLTCGFRPITFWVE